MLELTEYQAEMLSLSDTLQYAKKQVHQYRSIKQTIKRKEEKN
jgi:hypothetical protein